MGAGPSVMSGNNWRRLSVIQDARRQHIPVCFIPPLTPLAEAGFRRVNSNGSVVSKETGFRRVNSNGSLVSTDSTVLVRVKSNESTAPVRVQSTVSTDNGNNVSGPPRPGLQRRTDMDEDAKFNARQDLKALGALDKPKEVPPEAANVTSSAKDKKNLTSGLINMILGKKSTEEGKPASPSKKPASPSKTEKNRKSDPNLSSVLLVKDYHFAPCVASISLWSGKGLDTQALPIPPPKLPPPEPPSSPSSKKDQPPPLPEPEERPKQRQVEDKYNTRGGCRLILGSSEGSVRIFESSTRELFSHNKNVARNMVLRSHIHAHEGQVHCVKLYDDAFYAASWGQDSKIIIYDISHRTIQHTINTPHKGSILCGDISPDFQYMLSGGKDGHLFLWDLKTRENLCTMGTRPKDKTRKFRENHEKLLDTATPWDLGKEPWPGGKLHKDAVKCTAFVRETPTNRLISGGWDKKLLVWDLKSYASFTELEGHTSRITACDTAYDIRYCCTVSEDKTVRIWDLEAKVCAAVLEGHTSKIFSCNISSWEIYEPLLLSCGADGEFKMWDVRIRDPNLSSIKPQCRGDLIGHYDSCLACAICQDGSFGITLSHDGLVRVWRLRSLIKIILTVIVGEFGSGETSQFKLMVDPKDNVYSAKEQLRILLDTPISFTREGEPKFQVANPKFRNLPPELQTWTGVMNGRKKILDKNSRRLEEYGLEDGNLVTVVRQMSPEERETLKEEQRSALAAQGIDVAEEEEDDTKHSPGVSPTVLARQREIAKKKEDEKKAAELAVKKAARRKESLIRQDASKAMA